MRLYVATVPRFWATMHIWISYLDYCPLAVCLPPVTALSNPPWHATSVLSPKHTNLLLSLLSQVLQDSPVHAGTSSHSLARLTVPLAIWLQTDSQASPLDIPCHSFYFPYYTKTHHYFENPILFCLYICNFLCLKRPSPISYPGPIPSSGLGPIIPSKLINTEGRR